MYTLTVDLHGTLLRWLRNSLKDYIGPRMFWNAENVAALERALDKGIAFVDAAESVDDPQGQLTVAAINAAREGHTMKHNAPIAAENCHACNTSTDCHFIKAKSDPFCGRCLADAINILTGTGILDITVMVRAMEIAAELRAEGNSSSPAGPGPGAS